MLYRFILLFLLFTTVNVFYEFDLQPIIFFSIIFLMSYIIFYRTFIKDILLMSFMINVSFVTSSLLVDLHIEDRANYYFDPSIYQIDAKVIGVSLGEISSNILIETTKVEDLGSGREIKYFSDLLRISVSPYSNYQLYDTIRVVGEINSNRPKLSWDLAGGNFISENYSSEKLFSNTKYEVSNIKSIKVTQNTFSGKTLTDQLRIRFYETSDWIKDRPSNYVKDPYLGIAKGITFGEQEDIIKDTKKTFIDSGLIHIMVLSGANVSFIILVFFYIFQKIVYPRFTSGVNRRSISWVRLSTRFKIWATVLVSTIFILSTGLTAPSVRAGIMVNTALLSEYFSKNFSIKNSILLSLFILTLLNPLALVYSASLHLSYLAIVGLVFVSPKVLKLILAKNTYNSKTESNFEFKYLLEIFQNNFWKNLISVFIGITLSVGPYLLAMSEQVNIFGTIATIFLEPIILIVTILTFLVTLSSFVSGILATILGTINTMFISIILNTAEFLQQDIFITNLRINHTFVKMYYIIFLTYFLFFCRTQSQQK